MGVDAFLIRVPWLNFNPSPCQRMSDFRLKTREIPLLAGAFVAFFLIPYLPRSLLVLTDLFVVRIALLVGLICVAYVSPLVAVAYFTVLALLFIERNKTKMMQLERAMQQSSPEDEAIQSIETPATAPPQPAFTVPGIKGMPFMPQADSGENTFQAVAPTINQKQPLPTEGSNDGSQKAIHQLFEWVNPNLAQAPE